MATLEKLASIGTDAVSGLSGKRSAILAKAGLRTVADLLHHVPHRYIDRTHQAPIASVPLGTEVTVIGEVKSISTRRPRRNLAIIEARVVDASASLKAVWFNQTFRERQLKVGTQVALSGAVESFRGSLQMKSPDVDVLDAPSQGLLTGQVVPIHSSVGEITPGVMRRAMYNAVKRALPIPDVVPPEIVKRRGLVSRDDAFKNIHFPERFDQILPARQRLVYDELFRLELALAIRKRRQILDARGIAHTPSGELVGRFITGLPYELTDAQNKVLGEVMADLKEPHPMHRLLQGEVGSGKTVVAVATLLAAVEGGWQGAIMAPTEVLAEQHYRGLVDLLAMADLSPDPLGGSSQGMESLFGDDGPAVHVGLLTGSNARTNYEGTISRSQLLSDVASGAVDIVVGTHALIQEGISFHRLGVAVVDEQHRFGVAQRVLLKEKADEVEPDLLIMTATPIPRTLSMTLYGDLDVSVIDQMPPGRMPVKTTAVSKSSEVTAWSLIRNEVAKGRQAFVVCPLVEESEKIEASSAVAEHQRLSSVFDDLTVGLIHGQLKSAEKDSVMSRVRSGEIDLLVATTVIEVGIDIPNATVMVIEDADRFGLSQLHQLRGRVGRGEFIGTCVLITDPTTEEGESRIGAMVATTDGFRLAEEDLAIRGQGTVFGTKQSGLTDLKLANVLEDFELLVAARADAFALVAADAELDHHEDLKRELSALLGDSADWLFVS